MKNTLKSYVIRVVDHKISEGAAKTCIKTSEKVQNPFKINYFDAVVPGDINDLFLKYNLHWNYPLQSHQTVYDDELAVYKVAYVTTNTDAKLACALSHYCLWLESYEDNVPILILEHDAEWTTQLNENAIEKILASPFQFIGINDPRRATRKADIFYKEQITKKQHSIVDCCPWVEKNAPHTIQGLAGGSAYIIKPKGAKIILEKVDEYGLWHNDAQICHQLLPNLLGVTTTLYTKIQEHVPSTTTTR